MLLMYPVYDVTLTGKVIPVWALSVNINCVLHSRLEGHEEPEKSEVRKQNTLPPTVCIINGVYY